MVKVTAAEVNELRKKTGAGMMDCKKALVEAEGDFDKAIEILRKKGQKIAEKRADRDSSEGAVIAKVSDDTTKGVIVSLNCETDFVAKNDDFVAMANKMAEIALGTSSIILTSIPLGHLRLTNALSIHGCDSRIEVIFIRSELRISESETVVIINSSTSFFSILLKAPITETLLIGISNLTKRYLALHIIAMPIKMIGRIFTPLKNQSRRSRKK